jgi:hypothetical protein
MGNICLFYLPKLPNGQLSAEEEKAIVSAFDKLDDIRASGIKLSGVKYFTLNADTDVINGKKGVSWAPLMC